MYNELTTAPTIDHSAPVFGQSDHIDPYHFTKRETTTLALGPHATTGPEQPPRVIVRIASVARFADAAQQLGAPKLNDTPAEGLLVPVATPGDLAALCEAAARAPLPVEFLALELASALTPDILQPLLAMSRGRLLLVRRFSAPEADQLSACAALVRHHGHFLAAEIAPADFVALDDTLRRLGDANLVFTLSTGVASAAHATGAYRQLAEALHQLGSRAPIWIRNTAATAVRSENSFELMS